MVLPTHENTAIEAAIADSDTTAATTAQGSKCCVGFQQLVSPMVSATVVSTLLASCLQRDRDHGLTRAPTSLVSATNRGHYGSSGRIVAKGCRGY
jgi:hypothetical protein